MFPISVGCILVALLRYSYTQTFIDCPVDWYPYESHCYKFTVYPRRTYEEAVKTCEAQGAGLLSVNSFQENDFIDKTLQQLDPTRSIWFTSGVHQDNQVKWNGDGTVAAEHFWITSSEPNSLPIIIAYKYSVSQGKYAWSKVNGDESYNYICEIPKSETSRIVQESRDFTYGTNISDPSLVPRGPKYTQQPRDIVVTTRSYLPHIECIAIGKPQPTYKWYRTRAPGQLEIIETSKIYTISNGKLTYDSLNETRDAGTYYCIAQNQFGSVRSEPSIVSFGKVEQFPNVAPGVVNVALYQGTYLNCNPPAHKPALTYQWRKSNAFLQPSLNSYFFISANGNLYFSEVQQSDDGDYHCVVTLSSLPGQQLATSQPPSQSSLAIGLNVIGETASIYPPQIHDDFPAVFPKNPVRGQTITIECLAYGRMPLQYTWNRKEGRSIPAKAYTKDFNRVLVIPEVTYSDEGTYTCLVTGRSQSDNKDFSLTIGAKPYFLYPLRDIVADEDGQITWRCEALAKPGAHYSWYKNAQSLVPVPGEIEINSNVLIIRNLKDRHSGMYECAASNTYGISISSAQLKVLSLPPSFVKHPISGTILAALNGNLTIPCIPEAAPAPKITWLRNNGDMNLQTTNGDQKGAQQLINGYLKIVGVSFGDRGFYTCRAENKHGVADSTGNVFVATGVSITTPPPRQLYVDKNGTIFIPCEASFDYQRLDLVYIWKFNGKLIDFSQDLSLRKGDRTGINGLFITMADFFHAGVYECIAETTITRARASTIVIVRGPPGMPGRVYRVKGSETSHSIILKWTVPPEHGSAIQFYYIEARTKLNSTWRLVVGNISDVAAIVPGVTKSDKRQFLVDGLIPYNNYQFRIYAKNAYLEPGERSRPSDEFRIVGAAPVIAPYNVGGGGGSVGVLTITWKMLPDEYKSGPNVQYHIYWRQTKSTGEFQGVTLPETDRRLVKSNRTDGIYANYTVVLNEDMFYLPFDVKVGVRNAYGNGPNSTVVIVYSSEGIPLARPTNVNGYEINSTALWITWDPMENTRTAVKGKIKGYRINVEDFNNPYRKTLKSFYYGQMSANKVIGLEPNSDYWVTVQMFNSAGMTNPSERQRLSTCLGAPILYPEFVNIYSHGSDSVYVEWRGVSTGIFEETLRGYKMRYWLQGDDIRTANDTIVGKQTNGIIYGIRKGYVYKLRVLGYSKGGDGKMSPTKYFTLGGMVPVDTAITEIKALGTRNIISSSLLIWTFFVIRFFKA